MADLLSTIRAEIDERMRELAPALAEYERLSSAADLLAAEKGRAVPPSSAAPKRSAPGARAGQAPGESAARKPAHRSRMSVRRARERALTPGPSAQAILAALEHGSHTVAELVVVTALPAGDIRDSLRDLRRRKAIVRTDRDGRIAYALGA